MYLCKVEHAELNATQDTRQSYLPSHPVINLDKPENIRSVYVAEKYQGVTFQVKLLFGPDASMSNWNSFPLQ